MMMALVILIFRTVFVQILRCMLQNRIQVFSDDIYMCLCLNLLGMSGFARTVGQEKIRYLWTNHNSATWSRGKVGFFAYTTDSFSLDARVYTGLPTGLYCNVARGCPSDEGCGEHGQSVWVDHTQHVELHINGLTNPTMALHRGKRSICIYLKKRFDIMIYSGVLLVNIDRIAIRLYLLQAPSL